MIAALNGETLEIVRHRRGTLWCPFCDHSTFDTESLCKKCGATFGQALPAGYEDDTLSTVTTTEVTSLKLRCSVRDCGRFISTTPAAQANHRKKHEREAAK